MKYKDEFGTTCSLWYLIFVLKSKYIYENEKGYPALWEKFRIADFFIEMVGDILGEKSGVREKHIS